MNYSSLPASPKHLSDEDTDTRSDLLRRFSGDLPRKSRTNFRGSSEMPAKLDQLDFENTTTEQKLEIQEKLTNVQKITIVIGILIIILQIVTTSFNCPYTPSFFLTTIANFFMDIFTQVGSKIVTIAIEVTKYVSITKVAIACYEVVVPLLQICFAPYYSIKGIYHSIIQNYLPGVVGMTTFSSIVMICLIILQNQCNNALKPTIFIRKCATWFYKFYEFIYRRFMDFCLFYQLVGLHKLVKNFVDLIFPITDLIFAPILSLLQLIYSYVQTHLYLSTILVGFFTIVGLTYYGYFLINY